MCKDVMVPLMFHILSPVQKTVQLDSGATVSAMSLNDLQSILQQEDVKLGLPSVRIKLYDNSIVTSLGTYCVTVSRTGGAKTKLTFDNLKNTPWPIINGRTCLQMGWLSVNSVNVAQVTQEIHGPNSRYSKNMVMYSQDLAV